jgi:excisionase family DNA binding protein
MANLNIPQEEDIKKWVREVVREELQVLLPLIKKFAERSDEPFLTREEIAIYLRISLVTLADWVKRGLPAHRKRMRGRVLFIKAEVLQWVKENPELKYDAALKGGSEKKERK